ncbi:MAG: FGGY family carbohydrate kinase [Thermofilaceae archaeon]
MSYYLILDVGTRSAKAYAYSQGKLLGSIEEKMYVNCPQPGWMELDPMDVMRAVYRLLAEMESKYGKPVGVGVTSHRGSTVVWYKDAGEPLYNIITWQDMRVTELLKEFSPKGATKLGRLTETATSVLSMFGVASPFMHLRWIMENVEGARTALEKGGAAFGTVDSWVAWNLTGEHVTDCTNASATGIFDFYSMKWSDTAIKLIGIPPNSLPHVVTNDVSIGYVKELDAPLLTIIADQQASLYAAGVHKGAVKLTCGTWAFVDVNMGEKPPSKGRGVYPMIALSTKERTLYMLEGVVTSAGSVVEWLMDIGVLRDYSEITEALTKGRDNVLFIPALNGLGTPFLKPEAMAAILNLSSTTRREDLIRAALEGVAVMCAAALTHLGRTSKITIKQVVVDGGLANCDLFLQLIADYSGRKVIKTEQVNNSALGAYMLCENINIHLDPIRNWKNPAVGRLFEPRATRSNYPERLSNALELLSY